MAKFHKYTHLHTPTHTPTHTYTHTHKRGTMSTDSHPELMMVGMLLKVPGYGCQFF